MIDQTRLLKALMSVIDEGIHVIDSDGVTVLYNDQAGKNDGLSPDEVIGRHLLELFPSLTPATSTLLKVLATGQPVPPREQTFANYKGQRVTTINSTLPIFHEGKLVGAIEVSKDVTRMRELSERVAGLQAELLGHRRRRGAPLGGARYTIDDLVGEHPSMATVKERALKAARTDSPVLVYGETGTGKELLVHAIHAASPRSNRPLVAQNCAALPEGLLESLLFGTTRGSFTGAEDRPGLFELADGGTLYLDEINSMQPDLQAKLLRVLQDGRIRRLGEAAERQVDVRVIAATNARLEDMIAKGTFREDLYYRLNVIPILIPPLRHRQEDIPKLVSHLIEKLNKEYGRNVRDIAPDALQVLREYHWPGNVRELENIIGRAMIAMTVTDTVIERRFLPPLGTAPVPEAREVQEGEARSAVRPLFEVVAEAEKAALLQALKETKGNKTEAARRLEIAPRTLYYKLERYGLL